VWARPKGYGPVAASWWRVAMLGRLVLRDGPVVGRMSAGGADRRLVAWRGEWSMGP